MEHQLLPSQPHLVHQEDTTTDEKINHCLVAFTHLYEQKHYPEAFEQLWLALGLFEQSDDTELKTKLLRCAILCIPFFAITSDSEAFLQSIVAQESKKYQPEIVSMSYFILSVNALHE